MDIRFAVLRFLKAIQYKDLHDAYDWLSRDLIVHSSVKPFNKKEMLDHFDSVFAAFPDWKIDYDNLAIEDDKVTICIRMSGTHSNSLMLNMPGVKHLPATGKRVVLPEQKFTCTVENDQVVDIVPESNHDAGLFGLLRQIGAKVPPVWWLKIMWRSNKPVKEQKVGEQKVTSV